MDRSDRIGILASGAVAATALVLLLGNLATGHDGPAADANSAASFCGDVGWLEQGSVVTALAFPYGATPITTASVVEASAYGGRLRDSYNSAVDGGRIAPDVLDEVVRWAKYLATNHVFMRDAIEEARRVITSCSPAS